MGQESSILEATPQEFRASFVNDIFFLHDFHTCSKNEPSLCAPKFDEFDSDYTACLEEGCGEIAWTLHKDKTHNKNGI